MNREARQARRLPAVLLAAALLLCAAFIAAPRAVAEAVAAVPGSAPEVMLHTSMEWLDAPGGAAPVTAHAGEPLRPGMRIRVHTRWRHVGTAALPPQTLVIDAAVPDWLRFQAVAGPRRGATATVSANGFDFTGADVALAGEQDANARVRAVRWVIDSAVEPGAEGTLSFDSLTR